MDEIRMLISSMVEKDGRRLVRISFLRGRDYADGLLPEGVIEQRSEEHTSELQSPWN